MGAARASDNYLGIGAHIDENTLMADYWLQFVAARGDLEIPKCNPFAQSELQARVKEFGHRMNLLLENQAKFCSALRSPFPDPPPFRSQVMPAPDAWHEETRSSLEDLRPNCRPSAQKPNRLGEPGFFKRGKAFLSNRLRSSGLFVAFQKLL